MGGHTEPSASTTHDTLAFLYVSSRDLLDGGVVPSSFVERASLL